MANGPNLSLINSVNKPYSNVGEILTYTMVITNTGDTTANNVVLLDTIPNFTTYISNSFTVNGITQSGASPAPPQGGPIGNIAPGDVTTVNFEVLVNTIPHPNPILNSGTINYSYVLDPYSQNVQIGSQASAPIQTVVNNADIDVVKYVDKTTCKIGDILTYTISLSNIGNVFANNVFFVDTIPNSTKFVENSLYFNGVNQPGINPNPSSGVLLAPLAPGSVSTLSFQVTVVTIPNINPISNNGSVSFNFIVDPTNGSHINKTTNSNTVNTLVNQAIIDYNNGRGLVKKVNRYYATLNDVLTYTVTIKNTGNAPANNVIFSDTIPVGTTFIPNSVMLNGVIQPGITPSPSSGVNLGTINPYKASSLSYKVQVTTIPTVNPIPNSGTVNYKFTVNPGNFNDANGYGNSNIISTTIVDGTISISKSSDKVLASDDEIISYAVTIKNSGNIQVQDLILSDSLHPNIELVPNSVTLNGNPILGINIEKGLPLPNLPPNTTVMVEFKVKVKSIPNNGVIDNKSKLSYTFILNPANPPIQKEILSNTVKVTIKGVDFSDGNFLKSSNVGFAAVGDTITYSFHIKNNGNIQANEVIFFDTIPNGSSFIPNSLMIDGESISNVNPTTGISLGRISPGSDIALSFKTSINTIPKINPLTNAAILSYKYTIQPTLPDILSTISSNAIDVYVNAPTIKLEKSVYPPASNVGSSVTYTIKITNSGNISASNVLIRDLLPPLLEFEENSTIIDKKKSNYNIINGVPIDVIQPNCSKIITFKAKVLGYPLSKVIENKAIADYYFTQLPDSPKRQGHIESNISVLSIENVQIHLTKTSDVTKALMGTEVTYTTVIQNKGTVNVTDFIFKDKLPKELSMIPNTFTLNGRPINGVNIVTGVRIGTINIGQILTISYKTIVDSDIYNSKVVNIAFGKYNYKLTENSPIESGITNNAESIINVPSPRFKQLSLDQVFVLKPNFPQIEEIDNISPTIDIIDYHIVKTPIGTSDENQTITGNKLVINGMISNVVEYTGLVCDHSVHTVCLKKSFSTYIILPKNFDHSRNIKLMPTIEHVNPIIINPKTLSINIIFMINLTIL